ncbi:MAG TPA: gliding motility lipoprotein GldH [Chitinophagaceae bacterium]|nr:gliding motility lipoprotein GldH [Chitinophagaceae bacterium]HRX93917.1 gliding motility lipoprotein GldH [Chitinophagaceae bacterium]
MKNLKHNRLSLIIVLFLLFAVISCSTVDLYEKTVTIPGHSWKSGFKPAFEFEIKDTTVPYRLYFIIRHNEKYNYNNIFVNVYARRPDMDSAQKVRYDLKLADNENGWLASGMDDVYEHRVPLTPKGQEFYFKKSGKYNLEVEQIMREDPLQHVFNVGFRVEKANP